MSKAQQNSANFQYLNNSYSKHLTCRVCQKMFTKPLRFHPCGHSFCQQCVNHENVIFCPTCDRKIELKQPDLTAANLITDLKVRCKNDGCPWKGQLEQYVQFHKKNCKLTSGGIQGWLQKINQSILATQSKIKATKRLGEQDEGIYDQDVEIQEISSSRKKIKRQLKQQCQIFKERKGEQIRVDNISSLSNDQENKEKSKKNSTNFQIKIPKCHKIKDPMRNPRCVEANMNKSYPLLDKAIKIYSPPNQNTVNTFEQKKLLINRAGLTSVPNMSIIASLTDKYLCHSEEKIEEAEIYEWQISDQQLETNNQAQSNKKIGIDKSLIGRDRKKQERPKQQPIEISSSIFRPFDFLVNKHISKLEQKNQNYSNKRLLNQKRR